MPNSPADSEARSRLHIPPGTVVAVENEGNRTSCRSLKLIKICKCRCCCQHDCCTDGSHRATHNGIQWLRLSPRSGTASYRTHRCPRPCRLQRRRHGHFPIGSTAVNNILHNSSKRRFQMCAEQLSSACCRHNNFRTVRVNHLLVLHLYNLSSNSLVRAGM